jgi:hypothetical protein
VDTQLPRSSIARLLLAAVLCGALTLGLAACGQKAKGSPVVEQVVKSGLTRYANTAWGISFDYPSSFSRDTRAEAIRSVGSSLPSGSFAAGFSFASSGGGVDRHPMHIVVSARRYRPAKSARACREEVAAATTALRERLGTTYGDGPWILSGAQPVELGRWPGTHATMKADADPEPMHEDGFVVRTPTMLFVLDIMMSQSDFDYYSAHGLIAKITRSVSFR